MRSFHAVQLLVFLVNGVLELIKTHHERKLNLLCSKNAGLQDLLLFALRLHKMHHMKKLLGVKLQVYKSPFLLLNGLLKFIIRKAQNFVVWKDRPSLLESAIVIK